MLKPLANNDYARLFSAQVIALLGTGLTTVALSLLAYQLAGADAGQVLGTALAIKMIAYVTLAPIAEGVAKFVPRRIFLITLDVLRAIFVLCLPFVTQVWQIYLLIFLMQACSAGFTPVFQAMIPDILENEKDYTHALSLSRLAYDIESLLSPTLAGLALLFINFNGLFIGNAIAFLVSALLVSTVYLPVANQVSDDKGWFDRVTFGSRAYLATPRLQGLLAMSMAVAAAGSMVIVNTVVYVRSYLELNDEWTALLLAAFGFGSMVTALLLPKILQQFNEKPLALTAGFIMASSLALGISLPNFVFIFALWFLLGVGFSTILIIGGRLLQRSASQEDRPAYFAAQFALSHACWLITYPLAGWLSGSYNLKVAFIVLCSLVVVSTLLAYFLWPADDKRSIEHEHAETNHLHLHTHDEHHQHDHEGWEGPEPHRHPHRHKRIRHSHDFVIDRHHLKWPS